MTQSIDEKLQEDIVVDITGEVKKPGIIKIFFGARVFDVINKAGGITQDADISLVNQARIIKDGEHIVVPKKKDNKLDERVNINTATEQELQNIKGIGPSKAKDIIKYRDKYGAFSSIDDLSSIKGIKESFIEKVRDFIKVQ